MHSLEIKPIHTETIGEHEKELNKQLINIQLVFADEKFKENKKNDESLKFITILKSFTSIHLLINSIYGDYFYHQYNDGDVDGKVKEYVKELLDNIENIYKIKSADWMEQVVNLILKAKETFKVPEVVNSKRKKVGLFEYELIKSGKEKLTNYGFKDIAQFIQIHFPEFYKTTDLDLTTIELKKSLEKLAIVIIDQFPYIEGVVGKSWLMDSALAKRLGFSILEKDNNFRLISTWQQFVDKNGQINQKKLQDFLISGALPYQTALGIVKIEDFLRKYLPPERRGKIVLKEIRPEFIEEYNHHENVIMAFKEKANDLAEKELEPFLRDSQLLSEWLDTPAGQRLLQIFKEAKRDGQHIEDYLKNKKEELDKMSKQKDEFIKTKIYQNKEIII